VRIALGAAWLLVACSGDTGVTIDPLPIPVDLTSGAPIVSVRAPELDGMLRRVVVDTGSPISFLDAPRDADLARVPVTIEVFRPTPEVVRARIADVDLVLAAAGGAPDGSPVAGVLGGDVLSRLAAVRFDPARGEVRFLPDLAGESADHEDDCEAILFSGRQGGGRYELEPGVTFGYSATRLVVHTCFAPRPVECDGTTPPAGCDTPRADGLLVVATGAGPSVIGRSAWKRATGQADTDIDALPQAPLYLPGRQLQGELHPSGVLPGIALVGDQRDDRGPCAELACARFCDARGTCACGPTESFELCGCDGPDTDATSASVELATGVPVIILPDTHPLLQALRNELRPEFADVDGLLGMSALTKLVLGVDYGKGWVAARCADGADPECLIRPRALTQDRREELTGRGCLPAR